MQAFSHPRTGPCPSAENRRKTGRTCVFQLLGGPGIQAESPISVCTSVVWRPPKVIVYADHKTELSKHIHEAPFQVHAAQGGELASWHRTSHAKSWMPCVSAKKGPANEEELAAALKKARDTKQARMEEEALGTGPVLPAAEEPAEEESSSDEVEYVHDTSQTSLKGRGKTAKRKAKDTGKGKGPGAPKANKAKRCRSQFLSSNLSQAAASQRLAGSLPSLPPRGSSSKASTCDGGGSVAGASEAGSASSGCTAAERWTSELSLEGLLSGRAMGVPLWHARRALGGLKKHSADSVDCLLLMGHLDLWSKTEQLLPQNVFKANHHDVVSTLKELDIANVSMPPFSAGALCICLAQEVEDFAERVRLITPGTEGQEGGAAWHYLERPRLCHSGLADTEQAKLCQRAFIKMTLMPLMMSGEASKDKVASLCKSAVDAWQGLTDNASIGVMSKAVVTDMLIVAKFLLKILNLREDENSVLSDVLESRSGPRFIVRQVGKPKWVWRDTKRVL